MSVLFVALLRFCNVVIIIRAILGTLLNFFISYIKCNQRKKKKQKKKQKTKKKPE